ncbi:MAG TPA: DUF4870 domain-containing protein [Nocardioides sp.]|uniref:DUF4870 domain-containing protein n=1 Tax=Nocardioides sp. TaxID=35761 RepID=UPI002F408E42
MTENQYARPGDVSPSEERTMGMLAHAIPLVAMVVSAGLLGFVASLILYLIYKDRGPFARENAANSLNIQITTGIVLLISIPLILVVVGIFTALAAIVVAFVLHLLGALKANRGEWWRPPMTLRLVH